MRIVRLVGLLCGFLLVLGSAACSAVPRDEFADPRVTEMGDSAAAGDLDEVRRLRADGADIDARGARGATLLHLMVVADDRTAVRTLLAAGADAALGTRSGATALHLAVRLPTTAVLTELLAAGVDPSLRNTVDGSGAVAATMTGPRQLDHVRLLIARGCDLDIADRMGSTALHRAAMLNQGEVTLELLRAGADPTLRNAQGVTFQGYLRTTPARVRTAEFQAEIEQIDAELVRRGIPIEN